MQQLYTAIARTQDLTPPLLSIIATPDPDFTSFSLSVKLNEEGTIYALLFLAAAAADVAAAATPGAPPVAQVAGCSGGRCSCVCEALWAAAPPCLSIRLPSV